MIKVRYSGNGGVKVSGIESTDYGHVVYIDTPTKYAEDVFAATSASKIDINFIANNVMSTVSIQGVNFDDYKITPMKHSYMVFLFENLHQEGVNVNFSEETE